MTVSVLAGRGSAHRDRDDMGILCLKSADARSARLAFRALGTATLPPCRQIPRCPSGNVAQLRDPKRCTDSICAPNDCLHLPWERNILCHLALGKRCLSLPRWAECLRVVGTVSQCAPFAQALPSLLHAPKCLCSLGLPRPGQHSVPHFCSPCQVMFY